MPLVVEDIEEITKLDTAYVICCLKMCECTFSFGFFSFLTIVGLIYNFFPFVFFWAQGKFK